MPLAVGIFIPMQLQTCQCMNGFCASDSECHAPGAAAVLAGRWFSGPV